MEDEPRKSQKGFWFWFLILSGFLIVGYALGGLLRGVSWAPHFSREVGFAGVTVVAAGATFGAGGWTQERWTEEGWSPATIGSFIGTTVLTVITFTLIAIDVLWLLDRV